MIKYYYLFVVEYYDEATKTIKKGVHASDMFDSLEVCVAKMRYFNIQDTYKNIKRIKYKRVYNCLGKFMDLI